jgi:hypothetical protein
LEGELEPRTIAARSGHVRATDPEVILSAGVALLRAALLGTAVPMGLEETTKAEYESERAGKFKLPGAEKVRRQAKPSRFNNGV